MQTQSRPSEDPDTLKNGWTHSVDVLAEQLTHWAASRHWGVEPKHRLITEDGIGTYVVTDLVFTTPHGLLYLEAKPRGSFERPGRVELYAYPSLYRVLLIQEGPAQWAIRTDSGIRLRQPWNDETFISLAQDLLTAE